MGDAVWRGQKRDRSSGVCGHPWLQERVPVAFCDGRLPPTVKTGPPTRHPFLPGPMPPPSPPIFTWTSWFPLHFYDFWGFTLCKHYWICNNWAVNALLNEFSIQKHTLGIFIDLSKMFNTVSILLIIKSYLLLPFKIQHVVFLRGPFWVLYCFYYIKMILLKLIILSHQCLQII